MEKTIEQNISHTLNKLNDILFAFTNEQLNTVPFEGSWTGGQVMDHILKSLKGFPRLLQAPAEKTDRDPGEKIKALEDLFLNFTIKMKSPDFILPDADHYDKDVQLQQLSAIQTQLGDISSSQLNLLCTVAELPTFGQLTRLEWVHFFLAHTQRHTQQLKNIFNALKNKS